MALPLTLKLHQPLLRSSATVRAWSCGILVGAATLGVLNLGTFNPIGPGLDPSWVAALGEAASRGDIFGRDLIFTGGPLNALYTRYFDSVQWPFVIAAGALIATATAWSCSRLAANWPMVLLFAFSIMTGDRDAVFMALPALGALAVLARPGTPLVLVVLAAIAAAAVVLAKFSPAVIAVVSFLAIDSELVRERRLPVAVLTFVLALLGWYAALEGGVTYFVDFIRYSVETAAGYTAAMAIAGSRLELAGFVVLAAMLGFIIVVRTCDSVASGSKLRPLLVLLVIGTLGFTGFKAGFVRHDLFHLMGWSVLAITAVAYAGFEEPGALLWTVLILCLIANAVGVVRLSARTGAAVRTEMKADIGSIGTNLTGLVRLATNPRAWLDQ